MATNRAGINTVPDPRLKQEQDEKRPASQFGLAAGAVLLWHALLVVLFTLLLAATPNLRSWFDSTDLTGFARGALLMQGGFILLPTVLVMLILKIQPGRVIGSQSQPGSLFLALIAGIPTAIVLTGLNNLLLFLLNSVGLELPVSSATVFSFEPASRSAAELVLIVMISVLLPAICEELMFRGLIQASLLRRSGEAMTIFLQAFAFAAFHTDPAFIMPPFLAGLLLGLIRSRSGSLMAPILAHASLNATMALLAAYLPYYTQRLLDVSSESSRSLMYVSLTATFLAAVVLIPLISLIASKSPPEYRHRRQYRSPVDLLFILAIILLIATIIFRYFNP